jgi:hypothetical protein
MEIIQAANIKPLAENGADPFRISDAIALEQQELAYGCRASF